MHTAFSAPGTVCKYNVLQWIPVCSVTRTCVPSAVVVALTDILSGVCGSAQPIAYCLDSSNLIHARFG